MKLTKSSLHQHSVYILQLELGDALNIVFDPMGANAPLGCTPQLAAAFGTVALPGGGMALSLSFNNDCLYRDVPLVGCPSRLHIFDGGDIRPELIEFVTNEEVPRRTLKLKRVDYGAMMNYNLDCGCRCACQGENE